MNEIDSTALQSFHANISKSLHKLLEQKNGLSSTCTSLSLSWYIPCFKFIQEINRAFAQLVKDLDYPFTKWKGKLVEDYLSYTLNMLDALNLIKSSIMHLTISRINVYPLPRQHLKPITPKKNVTLKFKETSVGSFKCSKERVIHAALMKMRNVDILLLKRLLCGLCGEINEDIGSYDSGQFKDINLRFGEGFGIIKEIEEVNEVVEKLEDCMLGGKKGGDKKELKRLLSKIESLTEMVGKEVDDLFSVVLAMRDELIDCFRLPKCT